MEDGFKQGKGIASQLKCGADDLACLRKIPAEKILKEVDIGNALDGRIGPHNDGYFLDDTPESMIASGRYNKVPVIAGSNRDEVSAAANFRKELRDTKPEDYVKTIQELLGISKADADKVAALYPVTQYQASPREAFGRMSTDLRLACPTYYGITAAAKQQGSIYYYRFDYHDFRLGDLMGAFHSLEIPFVFDTMDRPPMSMLFKKENTTDMEKVSRAMQGYWTNFAKTGNPNGPGLALWPEFKADSQMVQVIDLETKSRPAGIAQRCEFWDAYSKTNPDKLNLWNKN